MEAKALEALTPKQRAFVLEYRRTGNGVDAARQAGYAGNDATLAVVASENLRKPNIKAAIEESQKGTLEKAIADGDEVLGFLTDVLRGTIEASPTQLRAAELLGKRHLLWKERDGEDLPLLGAPAYDPLKS